MTQATLKQLREEARRLGCELEVDGDCQCYRVTTPPGKCWEPELHELVNVFGGGIIGNGETRAAARSDLLSRLVDYRSLESCEVPQCDWCSTHNARD